MISSHKIRVQVTNLIRTLPQSQPTILRPQVAITARTNTDLQQTSANHRFQLKLARMVVLTIRHRLSYLRNLLPVITIVIIKEATDIS